MMNNAAGRLGGAALRVEHVSKRYGQTQILRDLSLEVRPGEFIVLLGPSGCGKTTLLRIIAGLLEADTGRVILGDKDITNLPPNKRDIGLVFQNYALFPHMSVRSNIAFGLRMRHMGKAEIAERIQSTLGMLQLEGLAGRGVKELSGGQQQRVATARALVLHPSILLLDEPLSNLDAKLRASLRVEITQLQRRLGITAIHVTHDQVEAMTMADRVVLMRAGVVQQIDAPVRLYHCPSNLFVASFIGTPSINLFPLEVQAGSVGFRDCNASVPREQFEKWIQPDIPVNTIGDGEYVLGVRPEDITLHNGAQASGPALHGEVVFLEALGSDTHVHIKLGEKVVICRVPGALPGVQVGYRVGVEFCAGAGHLFEARSEKRVGSRAD